MRVVLFLLSLAGCVHHAQTVVSPDTASFLARESVHWQWGWGHDPGAVFTVVGNPSSHEAHVFEVDPPPSVGGAPFRVLVSPDARHINIHVQDCRPMEDQHLAPLKSLPDFTSSRRPHVTCGLPRPKSTPCCEPPPAVATRITYSLN